MINIEKKRYFYVLIFILFLQVSVLIYFGNQKQNFHMDEWFSYYSSNDDSFYLDWKDCQWNPWSIMREKCAVNAGEGFDYQNVYEMEAMDVHPPLYYYFLHTVCSFFPDSFTKWTGLGLNIFFFIVSVWLIGKIVWILSNGKWKVLLAIVIFYGFNPAIISGVMFIRMYMLLSVFILLFTYVHLTIVMNHYQITVRDVLRITVVTFGGFLTHYYFIIFAGFFSGAFSVVLLVKNRKLYGAVSGFAGFIAGIILAVIYYPACIEHIFFGYRGEGAQNAFFDFNNTVYRFQYFTHLTSKFAFDDKLKEVIILGAACLATMAGVVYVNWKKEKKLNLKCSYTGAWIAIIISSVGYYLLVAKTALINEDEMIRYTFPVYGLLFIVLLFFFYYTIDCIIKEKFKNVVWLILLVSLLGLNLRGFKDGNVLFLYSESKQRIEFAKKNSNVPVVVFYDVGGWIWEIAQELEPYEEFYPVSLNQMEILKDDRVVDSEKLIVYADHIDEEKLQESINIIMKSNEKIKGCELISKTKFYDIYLFE